MKSFEDIIVIGTDTGVGKSVVSLLLMQLLYARGHTPFYCKPFQTGCRDFHDENSDAGFVYAHTQALRHADPARSVIYCHREPKAPFFAARDAGHQIDMTKALAAIVHHRLHHSPLVVEASGGLMVPITNETLLIDVIKSLRCRPLLVARAGLGTINHTLLSIEALQQRQIVPLGIVFVEGTPDPSDPNLVAENMDAIAMYSDISVAGVIPYLNDFEFPPPSAYDPLVKILF